MTATLLANRVHSSVRFCHCRTWCAASPHAGSHPKLAQCHSTPREWYLPLHKQGRKLFCRVRYSINLKTPSTAGWEVIFYTQALKSAWLCHAGSKHTHHSPPWSAACLAWGSQREADAELAPSRSPDRCRIYQRVPRPHKVLC